MGKILSYSFIGFPLSVDGHEDSTTHIEIGRKSHVVQKYYSHYLNGKREQNHDAHAMSHGVQCKREALITRIVYQAFFSLALPIW